MRHLAMLINAPMQSWGLGGGGLDTRTTAQYPTRSGIIGMLAAASGIFRDDESGLAQLNKLAIEVLVFRPGQVMTDLQTIGAAHVDKRKIPRTADGKKHRVAMTHRQFISGGCFGVILSGSDGIAKQVMDALHSPTWPIYLGRRSFPVTNATWESLATFGDIENARAHLTDASGLSAIMKVVELNGPKPGATVMQTWPVNFAAKKYSPVWVLAEKVPGSR
jgi:CRISPR system Cascade subunit CasD